MNRQGRHCEQCGRPICGRVGIISADSIFCTLRCKLRFPVVLRRRMIAHYCQMANDASTWIATTLEWNKAHPEEEPLDVEPLRLVNYGALEIVEALRAWAPIPERALRLIHSAMIESGKS